MKVLKMMFCFNGLLFHVTSRGSILLGAAREREREGERSGPRPVSIQSSNNLNPMVSKWSLSIVILLPVSSLKDLFMEHFPQVG